MNAIAIKNAKIYYRDQVVAAEMLVEDGKIARVAKQVSGEQTIDAGGKLVLPGAIDVHVHFRDLGEAYKEDWYTGSCAAAAGGVTTVIDQPNTQPPVIDQTSYAKKQAAARKSLVDYGINAAIDKLDQLEALWRLGVIAFGETFMQDKTEAYLHEALQIIERIGATFCVHAEKCVDRMPNEMAGLRTILDLNKEVGAKLHVAHVSTEEGLNLLAASGQDVTCEVTPHHLFLSLADTTRLGPFSIMNPPLRSRNDVEGLWSNLAHIDMIASDHAPHSIADKKKPSPPPGVPGVQTLLPLLLSKLDQIGIGQLVRLTCKAPAARFNLRTKGTIAEGFDADLTFIDLKNKKPITARRLKGRSHWTPFEGLEAIFPSLTMVRGEVVFSEGTILMKKGWGKQIFGTGKN
jgi:dihydroorotase